MPAAGIRIEIATDKAEFADAALELPDGSGKVRFR